VRRRLATCAARRRIRDAEPARAERRARRDIGSEESKEVDGDGGGKGSAAAAAPAAPIAPPFLLSRSLNFEGAVRGLALPPLFVLLFSLLLRLCRAARALRSIEKKKKREGKREWRKVLSFFGFSRFYFFVALSFFLLLLRLKTMEKRSEIKLLSLSGRVTSTGVYTNGMTLQVAEGIRVRRQEEEKEEEEEEKDEKTKDKVRFFLSLSLFHFEMPLVRRLVL
jgi:hypothetical protein